MSVWCLFWTCLLQLHYIYLCVIFVHCIAVFGIFACGTAGGMKRDNGYSMPRYVFGRDKDILRTNDNNMVPWYNLMILDKSWVRRRMPRYIFTS